MKILTVFLLSLMLLFGCRKIEIDPESTCKPIPLATGPTFGWNYVTDSFDVWGPDFNPNNSDEFVFVHRPADITQKSLVKYNMATRQKTILFQGDIIYSPSWGKNGWLLFNLGDGNIYKIKENGDSLKQLTFNSANFRPIWKYDGSQFCSLNSATQHYYLFDLEGHPIDTLQNTSVSVSWNHPRYCPSTGGNLGVSDIAADTFFVLQDWPEGGSSGFGGVFTDENNLVYSYKSGIYAINIQTKVIRHLKESCNSMLYQKPCFSAERQQILWLKVTYQPISSNTHLIRSRFVLTDVNGGNEEMIDVPW